jgi:hypothetical protein
MAELSSVQCVIKSVFNPASLTGTYQAMNGSGFSDDVKIFKLYNGSTTISIDISLDGVNNHDFIPPLGTLIVDFQAGHADNSSNGAGTLYVRKGQVLWGKTAEAPTFLQMIGYR